MTVAVGKSAEEAITLPAAAKRLQLISEARLREMVRAGAVPSTKLGRSYYLFASDIKAHSVLGPLWCGV